MPGGRDRTKISIEFLSFEGCPHSPALRRRLDEALEALGANATVVAVDLTALARAHDPRSGFGSPTILVNGQDLFGMASPVVAEDPSCRLYRPALPALAEIIDRLRRFTSPPTAPARTFS